jgi:hypothetical protein
MPSRASPLERTLFLTNCALLLSWFVWATAITSNKFWLVGGSEALVKVARHAEAYRWLLGGAVLVVLSAAQGVLWLLPRGLGGRGRRLAPRMAFSLALTVAGIIALGGLNWALFYDPLDQSVKSSFGGIILREVQLRLGEDGPCAIAAEVRNGELLIEGQALPLRWWPVPLEDRSLEQFLVDARCP